MPSWARSVAGVGSMCRNRCRRAPVPAGRDVSSSSSRAWRRSRGMDRDHGRHPHRRLAERVVDVAVQERANVLVAGCVHGVGVEHEPRVVELHTVEGAALRRGRGKSPEELTRRGPGRRADQLVDDDGPSVGTPQPVALRRAFHVADRRAGQDGQRRALIDHPRQRFDQTWLEHVVRERIERVGRQRFRGEDHRGASRQSPALLDVAREQRRGPRQQHPFPLLPRKPQRREPLLQRDVPAPRSDPRAPSRRGTRRRRPRDPPSSMER